MKQWVMLEGQALAQWHLLGDPDDRARFKTLCGLSLGGDRTKLRQMPDDQLSGNRCAACSERTLEERLGPLQRGG